MGPSYGWKFMTGISVFSGAACRTILVQRNPKGAYDFDVNIQTFPGLSYTLRNILWQ